MPTPIKHTSATIAYLQIMEGQRATRTNLQPSRPQAMEENLEKEKGKEKGKAVARATIETSHKQVLIKFLLQSKIL